MNNYALDHFGGEVRSYNRWYEEYERCLKMVAKSRICPAYPMPSDGTSEVNDVINGGATEESFMNDAAEAGGACSCMAHSAEN